MTEPIAAIARATAQRLSTEYSPRLTFDVDAALINPQGRPDQYTDPAAIAGLIVSIATLAWTIYSDVRTTNPNPRTETIARTIRLRLQETNILNDTTNRIVDIAVDETTNHG